MTPQPAVEGFTGLPGGMNATTRPAVLSESQYAKGINVAGRGGQVKTRPGFNTVHALPAGEFGGAGVWSLNSGDMIVSVIGGSVHAYATQTGTATSFPALLSPGANCTFVQADRYFVIQDGISTPVVLEYASGTVTSRDPGSIPPGFSMAYAHGRIHMVPATVPNTGVDGRAYLLSGDICEPLDPATVLDFTETEYLAEGGANALPSELGFIGGLGSLRSSQTGTGVGATIAFGRNGVCSFDFSIPRSLWKSQALSQVLFLNGGCRSPRSIAGANNDLAYRSDDGLRTVGYSISQNSGALTSLPVSMEMLDYLRVGASDADTTFSAFCDNRLVTSAEHDGAHFKALVSWDLAAGYYLGRGQGAAYDGLWTGTGFRQAVTARLDGVPRLFVIGGDNVLYVLDEDAKTDAGGTRIESRLDTRTFFFTNRVSRKRLQYVELFLADLVHDVSVSVWYRPHGYAKWFPMGSRDIIVPGGSMPQCRANVRISVDTSADVCQPVDGVPPYSAVGFQFAIGWTGYAVLEGFKAEALVPPAEVPPEPCSETEGVVLLPGSGPSGEILEDFGYSWED